MVQELGSGIALDEEWDFSINATGDLEATQGVDELEKDLAFFTATELQERIGRPISKNALKKVEITVGQIASDDPRVEEVQEVNASKTENEGDYRVELVVRTVEGVVENIEILQG